MKPKIMILFVVAVSCSLVGGYLIHRPLAETSKPQSVVAPKMKVLVARKKILAMTLIKKPQDYFVEKEMPIDVVPRKAIKGFEELENATNMPKRLNKLINEDMFVTTDDLVSAELAGGRAFNGRTPGDLQGIAIKIDPASLVSGFVLPGSKVDVVVDIREDNGAAAPQIFMPNMLVLAIEMQNGRNPAGGITVLGCTVTLAALPEEATRLALASSLGTVRLLLRSAAKDNKVGAPTSLAVTALPNPK